MGNLSVSAAVAVCAHRDLLRARAAYKRALDAWEETDAKVSEEDKESYIARLREVDAQERGAGSLPLWTNSLHWW